MNLHGEDWTHREDLIGVLRERITSLESEVERYRNETLFAEKQIRELCPIDHSQPHISHDCMTKIKGEIDGLMDWLKSYADHRPGCHYRFLTNGKMDAETCTCGYWKLVNSQPTSKQVLHS